MRSDLKFPRLWLGLGWTLIAFVVVSCLLPAPVIEPVAELLWDKAEHALAFFGMTLWFCGLYRPARWPRLALAFVALGILIELAQGAFTTTRAMDARDAFADTVGVGAALLIAWAGLKEWPHVVERFLPGADPRA